MLSNKTNERQFNSFECNQKQFKLIILIIAIIFCSSQMNADQDSLRAVINETADRTLKFDWPGIRIGTGIYKEGPTGVTVFHFTKPVHAAVDVRGGGPGTVNAKFLELGYESALLDAIVFSGGSWYGLETATAVASALKDDGFKNGHWASLALSVGAIIYDFGGRRLNEVYPDKRLAQLAFRSAQPGVFPLGPYGAGSYALSGGYFGCNTFSGQGGAFRQIGELKIAAFTVVNSLGAVTDRDGNVVACYTDDGKTETLQTADLFKQHLNNKTIKIVDTQSEAESKKNTTISIIITNQKLPQSLLQRLAVQVHTSMARAIQPFATEYDGDVLYAVSTSEIEEPVMSPINLGTVASELMWDAILTATADQLAMPQIDADIKFTEKELLGYAGNYSFSDISSLSVSVNDGKIFAQATGKRPVNIIGLDNPIEIHPINKTNFMVPGRYPLTLSFDINKQLIINPGRWQQIGIRTRN